MKNAVFWDVAPCRSSGQKNTRARNLADFSTLEMEAIRSSESSVHTRSTPHHVSEDGILCRLYEVYTVFHYLRSMYSFN
jgi:hypothetical protein